MTAASTDTKRLTLARVRASIRYRVSSRAFDIFESSKRVLHNLTGHHPSRTLFIFGAQRSGTTHLERLFRADPRTVVFGEFSSLSIEPSKTVWASPGELRQRLETSQGSIAVARSLLASHRAAEILDAIPGSRAVWMYRRADEVVASMIRKWQGDFEAISRKVETDLDGVWELEATWQSLHRETERLSCAAQDSDARYRDLYGLYWHARNSAFFEQALDVDPRIKLLSYQTLLSQPEQSLAALDAMIGTQTPRIQFPLKTTRRTPRIAEPGFFSPDVQARCDGLFQRFANAESGLEP